MVKLNIEYLPIKKIKPYDKNTKKHEDFDVEQIKTSIEKFGFDDPIGIWGEQNIIVEGHGRLMAAKRLKMKEVPCIRLDHLTDEQRREYAIAHNKTAELSAWDFENLNDELSFLDLGDFDFEFDVEDMNRQAKEEQGLEQEVQHKSLVERFGVPPFSILDTRQGYWQDRKSKWKQIGIASEKGRKENLFKNPNSEEYNYFPQGLKGVAPQTSIFDPVLCEIMYKWFCTEGGKIYDCFAGGSVRGVVAAKLGYDYTGIDLRPEQIDANIANAEEIGVFPKWFCDDSLNADKYIADNSCDMVFSCPPYADLEVYSDDPRDISNMNYSDFCKVYADIINIACRKLKSDRFAVFVVGDVRDKNGFYRNFIDYTKKCFNDCGLLTYNELILIEQIGTGAMRANKTFGSLRKVIKTHQNILVFYKGDVRKIKNNYNDVYVEQSLIGSAKDGELNG